MEIPILALHDDTLNGRAQSSLDQHCDRSHASPHEGLHQSEVKAPQGHVATDERHRGVEVVSLVHSRVHLEGGKDVGELDPGFLRCAHLALYHSFLVDLGQCIVLSGVEAR